MKYHGLKSNSIAFIKDLEKSSINKQVYRKSMTVDELLLMHEIKYPTFLAILRRLERLKLVKLDRFANGRIKMIKFK